MAMTRMTPLPTTRILDCSADAIGEAARLIRAGEPVAVPTETVYGLAADATSAQAVAAIYRAKGRPGFNPLIVHVSNLAMARRFARIEGAAEALARHFWPGALTLVVPLVPDCGIAPAVTAGLPTLAVRVPAHPAMQALIAASGYPLAAPSANASGSISPTTAAHVLRSLGDRIALILDDGPTARGIESTIVAPGMKYIRLLRPGPIPATSIATLTGLPVVSADGGAIEAPGQLASHYAPAKPLRLDVTEPAGDEYHIGLGAMTCDFNLSATGDLAEAAARLFAALHEADASASPRIAVAPVPHAGIGIAINDRLSRAAA